MKILHILPNNKFSPVEIFDKTSSDNRYLCPIGEGETIRYLDTNRVEAVSVNDVTQLLKNPDCDMVVFHSLPVHWYRWVLTIPENVLVTWVVWGFEMYTGDGNYPPLCNLDLYKPLTKSWMDEITADPWSMQVAHMISGIFKPHVVAERNAKKDLLKTQCLQYQMEVMARLDYVAPIFSNEMDLLAKIPNFKAQMLPFQYSKWHRDDEYESPDFSESSWILLGNSFDPTNNTLDVLQLLKERKIPNKVYMPMAYGEMGYNEVCRAKATRLGLDYTIQDTMIPYDEYYRVQQNCRVAVFAHIRQQASDNIHMSLLRGSKVYMYKDSVGYQYYKQAGFIVFSIEDDLTNENIVQLLTPAERAHNRKLVLDTVSVESSIEHLQAALTKIEKKIANAN